MGIPTQVGDVNIFVTQDEYAADNTLIDNVLDTNSIDILVIDSVDWGDGNDNGGLFKPDLETYNKLKEFVIRGGTVIHRGENWDYRSYDYDYQRTYGSSGIIANIVNDLGGTTQSTSWKSVTNSINNSSPTSAALDLGVVSSSTKELRYYSYVIDEFSNGLPMYEVPEHLPGISVVHMWDGKISGHLNQGVEGRLVYIGESGYGEFDLVPLLNYIKANIGTSDGGS